MDWVGTSFTILTGLIIFLYSIDSFTKEIKEKAATVLNTLLSKFTSNPVKSTFLGVIITFMTQSSTATTILTVSLVSTGVISFYQSIGILFGANIGTTIAAQLIAFNVIKYPAIFIALGFLTSLISKKHSYIGKSIFYLGLVFFGLSMISGAVKPMVNEPILLDFFSKISNLYLSILVGLILTTLVNASVLTVGIAIILTSLNLIDITTAIGFLLGSNIGTTLTSFIVSLRMNVFAKRAAVAHIIFNIGGVLLLLPFINYFVNFIVYLGGPVEFQVANAHAVFNVVAAVIFLIFIRPFERLVKILVKTKEEEIILQPKYLKKVEGSISEKIILIEKEIKYSLDIIHEMYETALNSIKNSSKINLDKIVKYKTLISVMTSRIDQVLFDISKNDVEESSAKKIVLLIRLSNTISQFGHYAERFDKQISSITNCNLEIPKKDVLELNEIFNIFNNGLKALKKNFPHKSSSYVRIYTSRSKVEHLINISYESHVKRLKESKTYSGAIFGETVSVLEISIGKLRELNTLIKHYSQLNSVKKQV